MAPKTVLVWELFLSRAIIKSFKFNTYKIHTNLLILEHTLVQKTG